MRTRDDNFIVAVAMAGVYLSQNGGISWTLITTGLDYSTLFSGFTFQNSQSSVSGSGSGTTGWVLLVEFYLLSFTCWVLLVEFYLFSFVWYVCVCKYRIQHFNLHFVFFVHNFVSHSSSSHHLVGNCIMRYWVQVRLLQGCQPIHVLYLLCWTDDERNIIYWPRLRSEWWLGLSR